MRNINVFKEIGILQDAYKKLEKGNRMTKMEVCVLVVPFREKYNLTDMEALKIAKNQMSISEMYTVMTRNDTPSDLRYSNLFPQKDESIAQARIKANQKDEFIDQIIDVFDDFLGEKITEENPDMDTEKDIIAGSDYEWLRVELNGLVNSWNLVLEV